MKKLISIFMVAAIVLLAASCATGEFTQKDANEAFDKIYQKYHDSLILDGAKDYTVVSGDTLTAIARQQYGDANRYYFPIIMLAANDEIDDPDLIHPGLKLRIPDLKKNLDNPGSRAKIKSFLKEVAGVYNKKGVPAMEKSLIDLSNSL